LGKKSYWIFLVAQRQPFTEANFVLVGSNGVESERLDLPSMTTIDTKDQLSNSESGEGILADMFGGVSSSDDDNDDKVDERS